MRVRGGCGVSAEFRRNLWPARAPEGGTEFGSAIEYFTHNEPDGVGTTEAIVLQSIADDPETLVMWREATAGQRGGGRSVSRRSAKNYNVMFEQQTTDKQTRAKRIPLQGTADAAE